MCLQINWANIGDQFKPNPEKWPKIDPCMVVVGTDLFVIGGYNNNKERIKWSWYYRLSGTGRWNQVMDYLMTKRANAACVVDKKSKDVFTIGGNVEEL